MKLPLPLAMVLLLLIAPAASAADRGQLPRMLAVAQQYFAAHAHNCPLSDDVVVIGAEEPDYYDTVTGVGVDWVPYRSIALDNGGHAAGEGGGCRIWLDEGEFDRMTFGDACLVVVHEYGHAVGLDHDDSRPNVMHGSALRVMDTFPPCDNASPYIHIVARAKLRLRNLTRHCLRLRRGWLRDNVRFVRVRRCWGRVHALESRIEALA